MSFEDTFEHVVEEENYFVSMTDMMVGMIFIFLIMLMYFVVQFRDVTEQLSGANNTRREILYKIKNKLEQEGVKGVEVDAPNGVLHLLDNGIHFDRSDPDPDARGHAAISYLATALSEVLPCYTDFVSPDAPGFVPPGVQRPADCPPTKHRIESVYIEGHTDRDPYSGGVLIKDNWDLSALRATHTYKELTSPPNKPNLQDLCARKSNGACQPILSVSGYGPQRPAFEGDTDLIKGKNRRIDLRLIMVTPDSGETARAVAEKIAHQ